MTKIGYARISTATQDLEAQKQRLIEHGCVKIFEDVASGRDMERTGFKQLMSYVREGDIVCVVRLDRLGRSTKELLEIVEELKKKNVSFVSLDERIDTTTASGELTLHIFASLAQFERRLIAERTRDGIAAARSKGKKLGRPKLSPDKLETALLLVKNGVSPTQVARQLGIGRSTIYYEMNKNS